MRCFSAPEESEGQVSRCHSEYFGYPFSSSYCAFWTARYRIGWVFPFTGFKIPLTKSICPTVFPNPYAQFVDGYSCLPQRRPFFYVAHVSLRAVATVEEKPASLIHCRCRIGQNIWRSPGHKKEGSLSGTRTRIKMIRGKYMDSQDGSLTGITTLTLGRPRGPNVRSFRDHGSLESRVWQEP